MKDENFHSELLVLLKHAYDDIERAKQMQWRDFYYVLIAIGAVTGLYTAVYEDLHHQLFHCLFFIMPSLLLIVGFMLIESSQETLQQRRNLVEEGYYPHLDKNILDVLNGRLGKPTHRSTYPCLYRVVIVAMTAFGTVVMVGLKFSKP
ncbi:MAG: hypothetical protein ACT4PN_15630 [Nitrospiraceae bacterium]